MNSTVIGANVEPSRNLNRLLFGFKYKHFILTFVIYIERPTRTTAGTGGQLFHMAKTSEVVGQALLEKNLKRNRKQMEPNSRPLDNAPLNLPDNDMAPPTKK